MSSFTYGEHDPSRSWEHSNNISVHLFPLTTDNKLWGNKNAGIAFFESMDGDIKKNTITGCKDCQFGIRLSLGSANNVIENNTLDNFSRYGLYTYEGSDKPEASDGPPRNNKFIGNNVSNVKVGVKVKDSKDIIFRGELGVHWLRFDPFWWRSPLDQRFSNIEREGSV